MYRLHAWGLTASSPRERRDGAELLQEEGILPKVGPRGQASSSGVPGRGWPVGSAVGSIALPGSGTNFGPCHAQGDQDTPRPHAGGQARDKVAGEAIPRAAPWLQAPCGGECLPPFPSRPPAVPGRGTEQPGCPGGAHPAPTTSCPQTLCGRSQMQGQGRSTAGGTRDRLGGLRRGMGGPHLPGPSPSPACSPPRAAACGTPSRSQTAPPRCCRLRHRLRGRKGGAGLGGARSP